MIGRLIGPPSEKCRASAMLPTFAPSDRTARKTGIYAEISFVRPICILAPAFGVWMGPIPGLNPGTAKTRDFQMSFSSGFGIKAITMTAGPRAEK